jgi:hypothetical protein
MSNTIFLDVCVFITSTNKTDGHDITEILLKVALNTITLTPNPHEEMDVVNVNYLLILKNRKLQVTYSKLSGTSRSS